MGKVNKKHEVMSCHGHVNTGSAARLCGTSYSYVFNIWKSNGLTNSKRNFIKYYEDKKSR